MEVPGRYWRLLAFKECHWEDPGKETGAVGYGCVPGRNNPMSYPTNGRAIGAGWARELRNPFMALCCVWTWFSGGRPCCLRFSKAEYTMALEFTGLEYIPVNPVNPVNFYCYSLPIYSNCPLSTVFELSQRFVPTLRLTPRLGPRLGPRRAIS